MINIAIAEDHQVMIDGLIFEIEKFSEFKVVLAAKNGQMLIDKLYNTRDTNVSVDIILMDINMPEMDGIEASRIVKENFPEVKIIIFTMFDALRLVKDTLKAGVDGYVLKTTDMSELATAIKSVFGGEDYFCKYMQAKIDERKKRRRKDYLDFK